MAKKIAPEDIFGKKTLEAAKSLKLKSAVLEKALNDYSKAHDVFKKCLAERS